MSKRSEARKNGLPDPGWYPDPYDAGMLRWWTGTEWGPIVRPPHRFFNVKRDRAMMAAAEDRRQQERAAYLAQVAQQR